MAKLYIDRLERYRAGQDRDFGIDVFDVDTNKRFARIVPVSGERGNRWSIRFFDKPPETDLPLQDILVIAHEEAERNARSDE